jgi:hypothetical protein
MIQCSIGKSSDLANSNVDYVGNFDFEYFA